jgi:hypothetical protein
MVTERVVSRAGVVAGWHPSVAGRRGTVNFATVAVAIAAGLRERHRKQHHRMT